MCDFPVSIFQRIVRIVAFAGFFIAGFLGVADGENHAGMAGVVGVGELNFRQTPGLDGPLITSLKKGAAIRILGENNGWMEIVWQGQTGYVKADARYVRVLDGTAPSSEPLTELMEKADTISRRMNRHNEKLDALNREEKAVFDDLDEIDSRLNRLEIKIRNIRANMVGLRKSVDKTKSFMRENEKKIQEQKDIADRRIVALYKMCRMGGMAQASVANQSLFDLMLLKNGFERMVKKDMVCLEKYQNKRDALKTLAGHLISQSRDLEQLGAELASKMATAAAARARRGALLARIRNQKNLEKAEGKMLAGASERLERKIAGLIQSTLEKTSPAAPATAAPVKDSFQRLKGLLKLPVKGKVISGFGPYKNPRNNITLYRSGIDIQADRGEPVHAAGAGKVIYAKWFKGYGNMMIIDHGAHYYTVYANIDELFKTIGDTVEKNEVIATVGDTASLKGAKLYFEIRHHGKPVDPMGWIHNS